MDKNKSTFCNNKYIVAYCIFDSSFKRDINVKLCLSIFEHTFRSSHKKTAFNIDDLVFCVYEFASWNALGKYISNV